MNAFSLINPALGIYVISAVLAWVVCAHKPLSGAIAWIGGEMGSAMPVGAGAIALIY
jgi:formate hydrogenlyase subunit 3